MTKNMLLRSAGLGAVLALGMGFAAHAADAEKPAHHKKHHAAAPAAESATAAEIAALKAEVAALEQRLDASTAAAQQAQAAAQQAQASAQAAQAAAQNDQTAISQIPSDVTHAVAALPKPANDGWYFKGVKFTPGGYLAMESRYSEHGLMSDGATSPSFSGFPYDGVGSSKAAHTSEWRASARQSRVSGLAEANVTPDIKLTGYGEFDFLGAAQTANMNESNSFNLRIRHIYSTVDFKNIGLSVLAGQTWSLATLNSKGITPRNEVTPANIDAQYNVGFVWTRQPQIRVTENFGNGIWAAVSVENGATNSVGGTAVLNSNVSNVTWNQTCGTLYNSVNNCSFNKLPDVIGKLAFDNPIAGHQLHVEGFGIYRDFYDRVQTGTNTFTNQDSSGWGAGFGAVGQIIPGLLDAQVSGLFGKGIGRYGTSQFADVYEGSNGALEGIHMHMLLAGLTFHATKALDIYAYYGEERARSSTYTVGTAQGGYGNPLFNIAGGCEASGGVCKGDTKDTQEATIGLWDKVYSGDFGSFRLGLEYSHVTRDGFQGVIGTSNGQNLFGSAKGSDDLIFTSIRYYPFQK